MFNLFRKKKKQPYDFLLNAQQKEPFKLGLKALCIADTHGSLLFDKQEELLQKNICQDPDIIICLGDITKDELKMIMRLKGNIPCIGIKGNHDNHNQFDKIDIHDINGKIASIKGIKIIGLEGSIKYRPDAIGYTQQESLSFAMNMPQEADLLVTHSHMYRKDDVDRSEYDVHIGLMGSRWYFNNNKCINIHGHDHDIPNQYPENNVYKIFGVKLIKI